MLDPKFLEKFPSFDGPVRIGDVRKQLRLSLTRQVHPTCTLGSQWVTNGLLMGYLMGYLVGYLMGYLMESWFSNQTL